MNKTVANLLIGIAITTLTACGGGGGSSVDAIVPPSITGTVAVGAPLPNANVSLKDRNGKTLSTTSTSDGKYTFNDVSEMTAPMMLQARGLAGGTNYTLHSLLEAAPSAGTTSILNATPATDAITAQTLDGIPEIFFADAKKIKLVDKTKLIATKKRVNAAIKDVLTALGQDPTKVDLITTAFTANSTGLDKLLDVVAFNNEDSQKGPLSSRDIKVTNKYTQVSQRLLSDDPVSYISPLAPPTAEDLALDTSGINALLMQLNTQFSTVNGIQSAMMKDLFASDYLENGLNRDEKIKSTDATNVGLELSDYVLNGCSSLTRVCQGHVSANINGDKASYGLPVKLGTDGKWRLYGDQTPFTFSLKTVAIQKYYVSTNTAAPTVSFGIHFQFSGHVGGLVRVEKYKSVELLTSLDDGATWASTTRLSSNKGCLNYTNTISTDLSNPSVCQNLVTSFDASNVFLQNTAQAQGKKWFKIVAFPNADYTGTPVEFKTRASQQMFNSYSAGIAIQESGLSITTSELNTNSVSFFGNPDLLEINLASNNSDATAINSLASWIGQELVSTFNGKATVAAAKAQCGSKCSNAYTPTTTIKSINLGKLDQQGRQIWMLWLAGGSDSSSTSQ